MIEIYPVGSKVSCSPPVLDTDEDYLVFTDNPKYGEDLIKAGWTMDTSYEGSNFTSYRRENINYIVTNDALFRDKFLLATRVSTKLNLLKKEDRITLFQAILYGNG